MIETKRQQQKKQTKAKLVKTAAGLFAEFGFHVSTSEIAKTAGVSHGCIFLHFPTREALVDLTIEVFFTELNSQVDARAKDCPNISDLLFLHLSVLGQNENFYRNLVTQMPGLPASTQDKLFAYQSVLSFHFEQVLLNELNHGRIVPVSFHMLFNTWMALVHYYLQNRAMFAPAGSVLAQYGNELVENYLKLIVRNENGGV